MRNQAKPLKPLSAWVKLTRHHCMAGQGCVGFEGPEPLAGGGDGITGDGSGERRGFGDWEGDWEGEGEGEVQLPEVVLVQLLVPLPAVVQDKEAKW